MTTGVTTTAIFQETSGIGMLGSRARASLLHHMANDGPSRVSDLSVALGVSPGVALRHVRSLEARGVITPATHPRAGRTWDIDRSRVDVRHPRWLDYVLGP